MSKELTQYGLIKSNLALKRKSASSYRDEARRADEYAIKADKEADEMERMIRVLHENGFTEEWEQS